MLADHIIDWGGASFGFLMPRSNAEISDLDQLAALVIGIVVTLYQIWDSFFQDRYQCSCLRFVHCPSFRAADAVSCILRHARSSGLSSVECDWVFCYLHITGQKVIVRVLHSAAARVL